MQYNTTIIILLTTLSGSPGRQSECVGLLGVELGGAQGGRVGRPDLAQTPRGPQVRLHRRHHRFKGAAAHSAATNQRCERKLEVQ